MLGGITIGTYRISQSSEARTDPDKAWLRNGSTHRRVLSRATKAGWETSADAQNRKSHLVKILVKTRELTMVYVIPGKPDVFVDHSRITPLIQGLGNIRHVLHFQVGLRESLSWTRGDSDLIDGACGIIN